MTRAIGDHPDEEDKSHGDIGKGIVLEIMVREPKIIKG